MIVSKIPADINNYAIQWAHKIARQPIEYAKGINFNAEKILQESDLIKGSENSVKYNFLNQPKDIYIHNHPGNTPLNPVDIDVAIRRNIKKMFAATTEGFCAIDFTTVKKGVSKSQLQKWNESATKESIKTFEKLNKKAMEKNANITELTKILSDYLKSILSEFADFSGAIFEDVKWNELI